MSEINTEFRYVCECHAYCMGTAAFRIKEGNSGVCEIIHIDCQRTESSLGHFNYRDLNVLIETINQHR